VKTNEVKRVSRNFSETGFFWGSFFRHPNPDRASESPRAGDLFKMPNGLLAKLTNAANFQSLN
jgi:hypothetical protein